MRKTAFGSVLAVALLASTGSAFSQAVVEFSTEDESTIYTTVTRERHDFKFPTGFRVGVGVDVPREVELREVPSTIRVESARRYRYAVIQDQVVLVDPGTRKVVRVIQKR